MSTRYPKRARGKDALTLQGRKANETLSNYFGGTGGFALPANAATLGLALPGVSAASSNSIPSNFDLLNPAFSAIAGVGQGTFGSTVNVLGGGAAAAVSGIAQKSAVNGLALIGGSTTLKFTYLGSEAGFTNGAFAAGGGQIFNNKTSSIGDSWTGVFGPGLVGFAYGTNEGSGSIDRGIRNNGACVGVANASCDYSIAYQLAANAAGGPGIIMYFGDGTNDLDMDDMAVLVQAVPIPAPLALFLTGLAGLGFIARRKRKAN